MENPTKSIWKCWKIREKPEKNPPNFGESLAFQTPDVLYIGRVDLDASETSVHQRLSSERRGIFHQQNMVVMRKNHGRCHLFFAFLSWLVVETNMAGLWLPFHMGCHPNPIDELHHF
jgi:hypothetical protein